MTGNILSAKAVVGYIICNYATGCFDEYYLHRTEHNEQ